MSTVRSDASRPPPRTRPFGASTNCPGPAPAAIADQDHRTLVFWPTVQNAHGAYADSPIAEDNRRWPLHLPTDADLPDAATLLVRAENADGHSAELDLDEGTGLPGGLHDEGHRAVAALPRQWGAARGGQDESCSSHSRGFTERCIEK
jgi:hypothetical protein